MTDDTISRQSQKQKPAFREQSKDIFFRKLPLQNLVGIELKYQVYSELLQGRIQDILRGLADRTEHNDITDCTQSKLLIAIDRSTGPTSESIDTLFVGLRLIVLYTCRHSGQKAMQLSAASLTNAPSAQPHSSLRHTAQSMPATQFSMKISNMQQLFQR